MILGLTGGIGSGKSTIGAILRVMGCPVFEADQAGREVLENDPMVVEAVKALFGAAVYSNGQPDRKKIASIVFEDHSKLQALNAIIHPAVARSWKAWAARHAEGQILVREAAILFESGSDKDCDKVLTVSAPESIRIQRVMKRDAVSSEEVKARMAKQWTDVQRRARADVEVVNDGQGAVIPQLLKLVSQFAAAKN